MRAGQFKGHALGLSQLMYGGGCVKSQRVSVDLSDQRIAQHLPSGDDGLLLGSQSVLQRQSLAFDVRHRALLLLLRGASRFEQTFECESEARHGLRSEDGG